MRERHGNVTAWLVVWIVWNVLGLIFNLTGSGIGALFGGNTSNLITLSIISFINIICYVLIFNWKFIGVIGKIITSIADLIINIAGFGKMGKSLDSMGSTLYGSDFGFSESFKWLGFFRFFIFMILFFSVLCKRHNGQPSTWDYLIGKNIVKEKNEVNSRGKNKHKPEYRKCKKCGKDVDIEIYISCPNCECEEFIENKKIEGEKEEYIEKKNDVIMDNKWICGNCGNVNDMYLYNCKNCNKERELDE